MRRKLLVYIAITLTTAAGASAQDSYSVRAKKYIEQYSQMAMAEQRTSGIPAAITLGQGILETEAGASELVVNANNHFGIKCKGDWQGETYTYTDDAPNECFKKYKNALESFHDHSQLLHRNPRYNQLFSIPVNNYSGWAVTIRKCGYATDPQYAHRLIKIIEEFKLQNYTELAAKEPEAQPVMPVMTENTGIAAVIPVKLDITPVKITEPVKTTEPAVVKTTEAPKPAVISVPVPQVAYIQKPGSHIIVHSDSDAGSKQSSDTSHLNLQQEKDKDYYAAVPPVDTTKVVTVNGLRAFPAHKGEMLLKYAVQYRIRYPQLLEWNDLPDAPLAFDCYVYLQKKLPAGVRDRHMVKDGESLLMVSQEEGIQLKRLMAFNHLNSKDQPVNGAVLELQTPASQKPEVTMVVMPAAHHGNAITTWDTGKHSNYITLKKDKPAAHPTDSTQIVAKAVPADKTLKPENKAKGIVTKVKNTDTVKTVAKTAAPVSTPADAVTAVVTEPMDSMAAMGPFIVYLSGDNTDVLTDATMQWIKPENDPPKAVERGNTVNPAALAKLKSELDPVVYADDSRLITANPAKAAKTAVYYTVQKGETATAIARKHNISVSDLLKWNNIAAADIKAGQDLKVSE